MKILIVRHGDPDYKKDSLTEKGWREAELLSEYLTKMDVKACYTSPLGRAKDTASLTLKKLDMQAEECDWLREFPCLINRPDACKPIIVWDWLPTDWTLVPEHFDKDKWYTTDIRKEGGVPEEYKRVVSSFDALIAKHGYVREHEYYKAVNANNDTIILFCHYGLECVLLSHLMNVSPMILWHGMCAAPSSVTTVVTEERRQGDAYFRITSFGATPHLYAGNEEPSFQARFCECFGNADERHD